MNAAAQTLPPQPDIWRKYSPRESLARYAWFLGAMFILIWSLRHLDINWE